MTHPSDERLREVFNAIEPYIENVYGIPVVISDVPDPFTGDLDGARIEVDYAENIRNAVFIVVHLFGHTVQWNVSERAREIGYTVYQNPSEELMAELKEYEREACAYSMQLFHDAGITDLDQWLSDFAACDLAFLEHFYRNGEKRPFMSFWQDGQPLMAPKPIPEFHPTKWITRTEGIVV